MKIIYIHSHEAWHRFPETVRSLIIKSGAVKVAELGAGANPTLPLGYIQECGLEYTLIDISEAELIKAPEGYQKIVADVGSNQFKVNKQFDIIGRI